jgi:proprotein convertase subtilisin/kexin type 7
MFNLLFNICASGAVDELGAMPYYAEECASMLGVTFSSGISSLRDIVSSLS